MPYRRYRVKKKHPQTLTLFRKYPEMLEVFDYVIAPALIRDNFGLAVNLSKTCRVLQGIFNNLHLNDKAEEMRKLFESLMIHVTKGQQELAKNLLIVHPTLAKLKAAFKDNAGRTFHATAFQYALWAGDWLMWKMLQQFMSKDEQVFQLNEFMTAGESTVAKEFADIRLLMEKRYIKNCINWTEDDRIHQQTFLIHLGSTKNTQGFHYDPTSLLKAYSIYTSDRNLLPFGLLANYSREELSEFFCEALGFLQSIAPFHYLQQLYSNEIGDMRFKRLPRNRPSDAILYMMTASAGVVRGMENEPLLKLRGHEYSHSQRMSAYTDMLIFQEIHKQSQKEFKQLTRELLHPEINPAPATRLGCFR